MTRHHLPLVTVQRRDGKEKVCPHCHKEIKPGSLYTDAKGWTFHRPCFMKGKGSIELEKEGQQAAPLSDERKQELNAKLQRITQHLDTHGAYAGTGFPRVLVPHSYLKHEDIPALGFQPSYIAVPERGQASWRTWRHPENLLHMHEHPEHWTVHADKYPALGLMNIPSGLKHVIGEGLPEMAGYTGQLTKDLLTGQRRSIVSDILSENPNAVVKDGAAPVVHERQEKTYTCGPAALKAIENTMGVGPPDQQSFVQDSGSNYDDGTPVNKLEETAMKHGLKVHSQGQMTIEQLAQMVGSNKPVLVAVQMDGEEGGPPGGWNAGHYVVVTDVSDGQVKFMDPAFDTPERAWPTQEFMARWHDHDHQGKVYNQWGMTLYYPQEVKKAFSGALGSGASAGQSATDPPRLVDATGTTPAGAEDQPASDALLDKCDGNPDPAVFDTAALEKAALDAFSTMSMGTEANQQPADDTGVQWTGRGHPVAPPWKNRLANMVDRFPAYQDSGTIESAGRAAAPSSAASQTGSSGQLGEAAMSLDTGQDTRSETDSDTISTGQVPHLSA